MPKCYDAIPHKSIGDATWLPDTGLLVVGLMLALAASPATAAEGTSERWSMFSGSADAAAQPLSPRNPQLQRGVEVVGEGLAPGKQSLAVALREIRGEKAPSGVSLSIRMAQGHVATGVCSLSPLTPQAKPTLCVDEGGTPTGEVCSEVVLDVEPSEGRVRCFLEAVAGLEPGTGDSKRPERQSLEMELLLKAVHGGSARQPLVAEVALDILGKPVGNDEPCVLEDESSLCVATWLIKEVPIERVDLCKVSVVSYKHPELMEYVSCSLGKSKDDSVVKYKCKIAKLPDVGTSESLELVLSGCSGWLASKPAVLLLKVEAESDWLLWVGLTGALALLGALAYFLVRRKPA